MLKIQFGYLHIGIPDVQDQEKDTAHIYHSAKLSPCVEVQLKIAEKRVNCLRLGDLPDVLQLHLCLKINFDID